MTDDTTASIIGVDFLYVHSCVGLAHGHLWDMEEVTSTKEHMSGDFHSVKVIAKLGATIAKLGATQKFA